MKQLEVNNLMLWTFDRLADEPDVRHFVSGRWAMEANARKPFTLSLRQATDPTPILRNRERLASVLKIPAHQLFFPDQVHKTRIAHVDRQTRAADLRDTDALITRERNICVAVLSADCVPVLLYDKANKVVAAVHSGWKGTVAKILQQTLMEMNREYGTQAQHVLAAVGPSVGADVYEVGGDVIRAVDEAFGRDHGLLNDTSPGKACFDLWNANVRQLKTFGVPASNVEIANLCTIRNNDHFFSARMGDEGRFASGIMLT